MAEVDWLPAGDAIRVVPRAEQHSGVDGSRRIRLFDEATERQQRLEACSSPWPCPYPAAYRPQRLRFHHALVPASRADASRGRSDHAESSE